MQKRDLRKFDWTCPSKASSYILFETSTQDVRASNPNLSIGTFSSAPFPRSEAYRAKGNHMRTLVQPPPSSQCHFCGGELRFKRIESASRTLELNNEIFVCAKCGREQSYTVSHDHMMPDPKAAYPND